MPAPNKQYNILIANEKPFENANGSFSVINNTNDGYIGVDAALVNPGNLGVFLLSKLMAYNILSSKNCMYLSYIME